MPIDPAFLTTSPEWAVPSLDGPPAAAQQGGGFGDMLGKQVQSLSNLQDEAAKASQSLADGTATDTTSVVMAVERARLAMQLASQLRSRGLDAVQEVMRTTV